MKKIKTLCSRRYIDKKIWLQEKKDAHTKRIQKKEEIKKKNALYCQKTKCQNIVH